jgi:glyoxylase-like metal-dependent hydrolase (beta-lactamase superfamily II)
MSDQALSVAIDLIETARVSNQPVVKTFFDEATFTATHVVHDPTTRRAAIIDPVLDFDQPSGRTSCASAQAVVDYAKAQGLTVDWLLETHAHADHLSAAPFLKEQLGGVLVVPRQHQWHRFEVVI